MAKRPTKSELVKFRLSPRDLKALDRIAARYEVGRSEALRTLIRINEAVVEARSG